MQSKAKTVNEYIDYLPIERQIVIKKLRQVIKKNLPKGFKEEMSYGMIGYVVPHSIYPDGYHCNPKLPLPFLSIASQKNFIAYYHMGIYSDKNILNWFNDEWKKISKSKLDMGKSCIRFKNIDKIPYELMGQLASKITPQEWIKTYENNIKR
ncbi:MAG: hypothetical protein CO128_00115 [Ignavibacteriales bacterium CG_4_9_14_3_um_filter_30_11]|nr:MAG: hypothetical protein CO128_00115 [Ignavibacteriales bacterium CG_4_9_14_3_um_filter_30_11]